MVSSFFYTWKHTYMHSCICNPKFTNYSQLPPWCTTSFNTYVITKSSVKIKRRKKHTQVLLTGASRFYSFSVKILGISHLMLSMHISILRGESVSAI